MGFSKAQNAPKKQFNFMTKKSGDVDNSDNDINARIKQLGFSKDTTVNELAARGVQISIRD